MSDEEMSRELIRAQDRIDECWRDLRELVWIPPFWILIVLVVPILVFLQIVVRYEARRLIRDLEGRRP